MNATHETAWYSNGKMFKAQGDYTTMNALFDALKVSPVVDRVCMEQIKVIADRSVTAAIA